MKNRRITLAVGVCALVGAASIGVLLASAADRPSRPVAGQETVPSAGQTPARVATQVVNGQAWSLDAFTNANGRTCLAQHAPAGSGTGTACADPQTLFASGPLHVEVDQRTLPTDKTHWSSIWVYGWVAPQVSTLVAVMTNCERVQLSFANGVFSHVFTGRDLPQKLIAYGQGGAAGQEKQLALSVSPQAAGLATAPACS